MESFLPKSVQALLLGLLVVGFALTRLARWFPDIEWLQVFRLPELQMSEEQKARRRRSANRWAGLEIIFAGLVLPVLYVGSKVMMFNEPTTAGLIIVSACSLLCFIAGIWVLVRNLRP
jgi:hypothetical protein